MDNKKDIRVEELENRLEELNKDLSKGYSLGKELARTKVQEELDHLRSSLFFL